jgi:membrane-bound ClpP family serine protease
MKHKIIGIIGVLLLVLGAALIIHQLMTREKSVVGSIAGGATPIIMGSLLLAVSRRLERKKASGDPSDTPK